MQLETTKNNTQPEVVGCEILPAFLESNFETIEKKSLQYTGSAPIVQVDICDGVYTGQATWPFVDSETRSIALSKLETLENIKQAGIMVELDLMIENPEKSIVQILSINPRRLVVHYSSTKSLDFLLATLHGYQMEYPKFQYGIAFDRSVSDELFIRYSRKCDYVQIMGIETVGMQGQLFDKSCIDQIDLLHKRYKDIIIQVDGSVSGENIVMLKNAGVSRFVIGSALSKSSNSTVEYSSLLELLA